MWISGRHLLNFLKKGADLALKFSLSVDEGGLYFAAGVLTRKLCNVKEIKFSGSILDR
jgi:hypothetical protein